MKNYASVITSILVCSYGLFSCSIVKKNHKTNEIIIFQPGPSEGIDAYIEDWPGDNYRNTNWGDYDAFAAVAWTAGEPLVVRCLLKFDLTSIATGTKIKNATLSLFSISTPGIGSGHSTMSGSNDFVLKKIVEPWDEYQVTWNTQPATTREYEIKLKGTNIEMKDYTDIDMTRQVQEMINHPEENYGLMICLEDENYYRRVVFGSSDNTDPQKRPKLVIEIR